MDISHDHRWARKKIIQVEDKNWRNKYSASGLFRHRYYCSPLADNSLFANLFVQKEKVYIKILVDTMLEIFLLVV
jgi:hypothetical protein